MVWLYKRGEAEEGPVVALLCVLMQVVDDEVGGLIDAIAFEIDAAVLGVVHEAFVAVAGVFEDVRGDPVVGVTAPPFEGDGRGVEVVVPVGREVPLADVGGAIAVGGELPRDGAGIEGQRDIVGHAAGLRGVKARLEAGSRRAADRLHGEGEVESHALGCDAVEVRREVQVRAQRLTIAAHGVPALLVAEDEEDIRPCGHGGLFPVK